MASRLELILTRYGDPDREANKEETIDLLESYISECNEAVNKGSEVVPDAIYDTLIDFLRELKPDSELLKSVWSEDVEDIDEDLDKHLVEHPMMSIQTIKSMNDKPLATFKGLLPAGETEVCVSAKENGFGIRIVLKNGVIVKAHTRGRHTNGKSITRQLKLILPDKFDELEGTGLVEVRGEVVLPYENFDKARSFNPAIKTPFTGVSSMLRDSATEEETKLLHFVAYDVYGDNLEEFERLSDKFTFLEAVGFTVPQFNIFSVSRGNFEEDIEDILDSMDSLTDSSEFYLDGIVVAVDDIALFDEFGAEEHHRYGNVALKMGKWKQNNYQGEIDHIDWINGKKKKTPVAVLSEPVETASGNTVRNIPLYAPCYILMLDAYPGNIINFKYGGEAGVIPVTPDGRLVTEVDKD